MEINFVVSYMTELSLTIISGSSPVQLYSVKQYWKGIYQFLRLSEAMIDNKHLCAS